MIATTPSNDQISHQYGEGDMSGLGDTTQYQTPIDKIITLQKTDPVMADLVTKGVISIENVPIKQVSPFGKTVGNMTYPVPDNELDIFSGGEPDAYLKSLKENNDAVSVELPQTYDEWLDKYKSNEDLSGSGNLIQDIGAGMGKNLDDLVNMTKTIQGGYGNPDENYTLEELTAGMNATQPYNNPLLDSKGYTPDVPPSAWGATPMQLNQGEVTGVTKDGVKTGFSGTTAADVSSPLANFGQNEIDMGVMYNTDPNYKVHPSYGEAKGMNVNNFPGFGRTGLADIPVVGGVLDNMVGVGQSALMGGGDLLYQGIQAATDKDKSFSNVIPSAFEQWKGYNQARFDPSIDTSSAQSLFDAAALLESQPSAEAIRIANQKEAGTFAPMGKTHLQGGQTTLDTTLIGENAPMPEIPLDAQIAAYQLLLEQEAAKQAAIQAAIENTTTVYEPRPPVVTVTPPPVNTTPPPVSTTTLPWTPPVASPPPVVTVTPPPPPPPPPPPQEDEYETGNVGDSGASHGGTGFTYSTPITNSGVSYWGL